MATLSRVSVDDAYTVRDATNADVDQINRLFLAEYGEGYPYLMHVLNARHINLVAELDGRIVGFARAAPYGQYVDVWELCSLVVCKRARRHGIAKRFTGVRLERLKERGVRLVVSEGVTCYEDCASQRNLTAFGFRPCGLLPFRHPWIRPAILGMQPLTLTVQVLELSGKTGFGRRRLFLPESYTIAAEELFSQQEVRPPWHQSPADRSPPSKLTAGKMIRGIRGADYVDIPINWEIATERIQQLRLAGYGMGAILPGFGRVGSQTYDVLRMHRPDEGMNDPDFNLIHVVDELAAHKAFIMHEFGRI